MQGHPSPMYNTGAPTTVNVAAVRQQSVVRNHRKCTLLKLPAVIPTAVLGKF